MDEGIIMVQIEKKYTLILNFEEMETLLLGLDDLKDTGFTSDVMDNLKEVLEKDL